MTTRSRAICGNDRKGRFVIVLKVMGEKWEEIFGAEGPIAQKFPGYEYREEQVRMAKAIENCIGTEENLVVEAGTGVGKSFAYLIPLIDYINQTKEKAVVSTYTIALQEQLAEKDIPALQKIIPFSFKVSLAKGRKNYLCLRRLARTSELQGELFEKKNEFAELNLINEWSKITADGSLSDLPHIPSSRVWDKVCCQQDNCLGKRCPYEEKCFFKRARKRLYQANLLIVNHHLFFSDLALRIEKQNILPLYKIAVLDEAHNLEKVAGAHLGLEVSNFRVRYLLNSLAHHQTSKRDSWGGFLATINLDRKVFDYIEKIKEEVKIFFREIEEWTKNKETKRIKKPNFVENRISLHLEEIAKILARRKRSAGSKEEELEITAYIKRCLNLSSEIRIILKQSLQDYVYWAEASRRKRYKRIALFSSPINVAEHLREHLFKEKKAIIMTSATLAVNNSFNYFKERVGLKETKELLLGSPFDYKKQVKLYLCREIPAQTEKEYQKILAEKIKHYLLLTRGKAFVLFTNYKVMQKVYRKILPFLAKRKINSFLQGSGIPRHKMLEAFKKDINSVLFGTESFWMGVDVAGESLSNVIITKLPFSVPDHPLIEARIERIEARNGNPFLEYSLPEAIIKLRQGFGRLIRNKTDKGIVVILDNRVLTKFYGKSFLSSLPKCQVIVE